MHRLVPRFARNQNGNVCFRFCLSQVIVSIESNYTSSAGKSKILGSCAFSTVRPISNARPFRETNHDRYDNDVYKSKVQCTEASGTGGNERIIGRDARNTRSSNQDYGTSESRQRSAKMAPDSAATGKFLDRRRTKLINTVQAPGLKGFQKNMQDHGIDAPEESDSDKPKTAYDIARGLRNRRPDDQPDTHASPAQNLKDTSRTKQFRLKNDQDSRENVDSQGFNTYDHLMPKWEKMTADDVVTILKKRIIYNDHDIVALDKPYGLPVHGGPTVHHNVARYLPQLAAILVKDGTLRTLYLVNRLDKETTGVLLLARTSEAAAKLHDMFLKRMVKKQYWVLTRGVPNPRQGIIDIPIGDSMATGTNRRVLRPARTETTHIIMNNSKLEGSQAVTPYKVLGCSDAAALVEADPRTGCKHQVRIHLSHGLNCPILGDHKYSHFTKLAPQRLPPDMLRSLKMRQSKVRTLPMHLHARSLVLPEYKGSENIVIEAHLPPFFSSTMSKLRIKLGKFN